VPRSHCQSGHHRIRAIRVGAAVKRLLERAQIHGCRVTDVALDRVLSLRIRVKHVARTTRRHQRGGQHQGESTTGLEPSRFHVYFF
jgi:hypothetical protein